jgi:hypothetical protein
MRDSEYQMPERRPNIMQNRHGVPANQLTTCDQCRHLSREGDQPWVCEQFTTPSGYRMPWAADNRACGLFEERGKEVT